MTANCCSYEEGRRLLATTTFGFAAVQLKASSTQGWPKLLILFQMTKLFF